MPKSTLASEIEDLENCALPALKSDWEATFDTAPPRGISRKLMIRALVHSLQVKAEGGLKARSRKQLLKAIPSSVPTPVKSTSTLPPGARMLREWNGVMHRVDVTEDGFCWNGRTWGSLSAVAREITGTRWNGPLFFGLRQKKGKAR